MESGVSNIILLAVTITIAVSVAFWMGGVSSSYTHFEKLEINVITCELVPGAPGPFWKIAMTIKNTGSKQATLVSVYLNGVLVDVLSAVPPVGGLSTSLPAAGLPIQSGETVSTSLSINRGYANLSSGTSVHIKLRSAAGMEYPILVVLT